MVFLHFSGALKSIFDVHGESGCFPVLPWGPTFASVKRQMHVAKTCFSQIDNAGGLLPCLLCGGFWVWLTELDCIFDSFLQLVPIFFDKKSRIIVELLWNYCRIIVE